MTNIMIITGGTGGHITPAIALAEQLVKRNHKVTFLVDQKFAKYNLTLPVGVTICIVDSSSPFVGGLKGKINFFLKASMGVMKSLVFMYKNRVKIIVSFGGYMSFSGLISAIILGKKYIIHEQNSVIGRANLFFASRALYIATSFKKIFNLKQNYQKKIFYVGKLVRQEFLSQYDEVKAKNSENIAILVTCGSQAAKSFSDIIPRSIALIDEKKRKKIIIYQQAKKEDIEFLQERYKNMNIKAEISSFFPKISELFAKTDLIIARAGSSTIAEIAVTGKASILIPLPNSVDDHQLSNAKSLYYQGTAWYIEENGETVKKLSELLEKILDNPEILFSKTEDQREFSENGSIKMAELIESVK